MDDVRTETQEQTPTPQENLPAAVPAPGGVPSIWSDQNAYAIACRQAKVLAQSDLVPEGTYRNKPANCLIALDMANRMGMSPLNVMQNLSVIKGKPGWSGQFCVAAVNSSPRFSTKLEFVQLTNEDGTVKGYFARATDAQTGHILDGPPVTWEMVKAEGWLDKNGSKWKTMPTLMFHYRAAAFFARTFCPEVLNGLQTVEELKDVRGYDKEDQPSTVITLDS